MKKFKFFFCESIEDVWASMTPVQREKCEAYTDINHPKSLGDSYKLGYRLGHVIDGKAYLYRKLSSKNHDKGYWNCVIVGPDGNAEMGDLINHNDPFIKDMLKRWHHEDMQKRYGDETGNIVNEL